MKIAISGAGVAGPAFAHWMMRVGHEVTLIEKAPTFRTGGYLIDFWGVGYAITQKMGIEDDLHAAGYRVRELHIVDDEGRASARLRVDPLRRAARDRYISLPRGDLAEAIYRTVEHDIETVYSESITALDNRSDGVTVEFEHTQPRQFDMVIGADGLHSNVRALAFGPDARYERYLGCQVAACVLDGYRPRDDLVYVTHNVPDRQIGRFSLRGDRTLVLFIFRSPTPALAPDLDSCKALLRSEFADTGWESTRILDALDGVDDIYFDVVSQIRIDRWSTGRVALIGDAAACVSLLAGEGTGLAIAEAYALAGELDRAGEDIGAAFEAYENRLREFIEAKQDGAQRLISFFTPRTKLGIWLRDLAIRAFGIPPVGNLVVGRTLRDDIALPEYELPEIKPRR